MLCQSISADFLRFCGVSPARWNRLRCRASARSIPERIIASCAGSQLDAVRWPACGHLEASGLESLVPDGQPVGVEVEDLDAIPAAVEKEEEMAG